MGPRRARDIPPIGPLSLLSRARTAWPRWEKEKVFHSRSILQRVLTLVHTPSLSKSRLPVMCARWDGFIHGSTVFERGSSRELVSSLLPKEVWAQQYQDGGREEAVFPATAEAGSAGVARRACKQELGTTEAE